MGIMPFSKRPLCHRNSEVDDIHLFACAGIDDKGEEESESRRRTISTRYWAVYRKKGNSVDRIGTGKIKEKVN